MTMPRLAEHRIVSVADLKPYARNARTHTQRQVDQIAESIRRFSFTNPLIVDPDMNMIAGHGRLEAAKAIGMTELPVMVVSGLSKTETRALIIADNKIALNAGWDDDMLKSELADLIGDGFDIDITGFDIDELDDMFDDGDSDTPDDIAPDVKVDVLTKLGDVWICGNHGVMCGDATDLATVEILTQGKRPDMVFTDPPYNIDYQGMTDKHEKIANDKMSDADFLDFLQQPIMPCEVMYVCCSWQYASLFKQAMENLDRKPKAMIVWDKVNPAQHLDLDLYFKQHEIIFYHGPFGGQTTVRGDVWEMKRQRNTVHPTMKPVELIEMALADHPKLKVVYDGFGGSGSTLIACEKTERACMTMELSPAYCDVIVRRWQNYTGQVATLQSDGRTFDAIAGGK